MNPRVTDCGEARRKLKLRDRALHKIANVNYTGVRFEDGQWKLHVGVIKKLPEHDKLLNPAINFSGLPLIFDELGEIKALAVDRKIKYRPAPPGVSIGHKDITAGTFSVTCFKDGTKYLLSNNHVFANMNAGEIGDAILQPGVYDGGVDPDDRIGTLAAFVPLVFNDQVHPNYVDCAIAIPTNVDDLLDEILEIGNSTGSKEAAIGQNVIKSGRTTGITQGTITEFSGLIAVGYGDSGTAYFDDQIVTGPMLQGGDSGSCLLDSSDFKAVGLCFAASSVISIACRMTEVMAALDITIFQGIHHLVPIHTNIWGTELIGNLCPIGETVIVKSSMNTPYGHTRSGSLSPSRLMLMDDERLHVFDPGGNNSLFSNQNPPTLTTLIDRSCRPAYAMTPEEWETVESPTILSHNGVVISEKIVMFDETHPWIMMDDMFIGSDSFAATETGITVSMIGGDTSVPIIFSAHSGFQDNTGLGIPVVVNGQRYWIFSGTPYSSSVWQGTFGFGYFALNDAGAVIGNNWEQTGTWDLTGAYDIIGYNLVPITAWVNGSCIEFAYWDYGIDFHSSQTPPWTTHAPVPGLMHICRISDPAGLGGWSEVAQIQIDSGKTIDSTYMADDGWFCFVLSVGGDKSLLWYKDGEYHEDALSLHTSADDVDFYIGAPEVGTLHLYGGTYAMPKGVFGFKYVDATYSGWLHVGVRTVELWGDCPTETIYHTILKQGIDFHDEGNGIGFAYPSVATVNGKTFFLFGVDCYKNVGSDNFEECLVSTGEFPVIVRSFPWVGKFQLGHIMPA